jgi:hypothetical protein
MEHTTTKEKFWDTMLEDGDKELTIGMIDIYKINMFGAEKYCLFIDKMPVTKKVESIYGVHGGSQPTLQDAVDVALIHEYPLG